MAQNKCTFVFSTTPQDYRQREEEEWWKTWREGRALAAARLQAAVRGQGVRRQLWAEVREAVPARSDIREDLSTPDGSHSFSLDLKFEVSKSVQ